MSKFGSPSVKISLTRTSATGAKQDISNYVDELNGLKLEAMTQESHAFGDAWVENFYTGVKRFGDVTVAGFYDDAGNGSASGPHTLMGQTSDVGATRYCEIDFGSSDIVRFKYVLGSYERAPKRGELTRFQSVMKVTGAVATTTGVLS